MNILIFLWSAGGRRLSVQWCIGRDPKRIDCSDVAQLFGVCCFISSQTAGKHEPSAVIIFSLRRLKVNVVTFGAQTEKKGCPTTDEHERQMSGQALHTNRFYL